MPDETSPAYEVRLTRAAIKDLQRLRAQATTAVRALDRLRTNPAAGHLPRGSLAGVRSLAFTFPRSGAGRAAYVILLEQRVCLVFLIGPHEGFYARAERRAAALDPVDDGGAGEH